MEKLENIISTYQQIIQESEQALQRSHSGSLYLLERRLVISFRLCHSAFYIIYLAGKTT